MSSRRTAKARILAASLLDVVVDVLVPLVVTLLLTTVDVTSYLALAAGGVVIGAKAALGRIAEWRLDRHAVIVGAVMVVGLVLLFGLPALGVADVVAAAAAAVVTAVPVLASIVDRRSDGIGLLVLAEIAASVVITLVSDDPRFVLARPAVYTAVAGVFALVTCVRGRPLMLDATKPMAAAGDPVRGEAFEAAWQQSAAFRRVERAMTAGLGGVLIAEAVLRVVVVYASSDPDVVVTGLLAQVPAVALFVVYALAVRVLAVPRARAIVDGLVPARAVVTASSGPTGRPR